MSRIKDFVHTTDGVILQTIKVILGLFGRTVTYEFDNTRRKWVMHIK